MKFNGKKVKFVKPDGEKDKPWVVPFMHLDGKYVLVSDGAPTKHKVVNREANNG